MTLSCFHIYNILTCQMITYQQMGGIGNCLLCLFSVEVHAINKTDEVHDYDVMDEESQPEGNVNIYIHHLERALRTTSFNY